MIVAALSGDYVPTVQNEITSLYGTNIGITTPKTILQARERFTNGNNAFIQDVAFIALLVGTIGIVTTLYNSVNERISEIGTIKAIGAPRMFILLMFLFEALMIGLIGSALGVVSGMAGAYALSSVAGPHGQGLAVQEAHNLKSHQYSYLVICKCLDAFYHSQYCSWFVSFLESLRTVTHTCTKEIIIIRVWPLIKLFLKVHCLLKKL